jgi:hypothetical protein
LNFLEFPAFSAFGTDSSSTQWRNKVAWHQRAPWVNVLAQTFHFHEMQEIQ